jgi:hypothetical protein
VFADITYNNWYSGTSYAYDQIMCLEN